MKKSLCLILILCFFLPISLFAESIEQQLTSEQLREFNYSKLSFDTQSGSFGSLSQYGSFSTSNYKYWIPFEGTEKISEPLFFEIAGYEKEALAAQKYEKTRDALFWSGLITSAAGFLISISADYYDDARYTTGMVIACIGAGATAGGFGMMISNKYPSNIAEMAASDYNTRLANDLLGK